ncbi:hypothetical protein OQA88_7109 [Cercophora sp. LCS_1]
MFDCGLDLKFQLTAWRGAYQNTTKLSNNLANLGYQLLLLHYTMATILCATCLAPDDEMAYDQHHESFVSILSQATDFLQSVHKIHSSTDPVFGNGADKSSFAADVGWIAPLYFTALHCRYHDIRSRAIAFLRVVPSREGAWDSMFAAAVAEEVLRIEEGDNTELWGGTIVPRERRVLDVRITLPDGLDEEAVFTCRRGSREEGYLN